MITSFFNHNKPGAKNEVQTSSPKLESPEAKKGSPKATGKSASFSILKGSPSRKRSLCEVESPSSESKKQKVSVDSPYRVAFDSMEESWKFAMSKFMEITKNTCKEKLITFLESEKRAGKVVYPPPEDIFSFMLACPLDNVKVVIVGQDPYHGPGQGHGMCFSVRKGIQIPPSLRNMLKEAKEDPDLQPKFQGNGNHGCLSRWSEQGVLLLNTCLTVRKAEPLSHKGKGWEDFADEVIRQCTLNKENIVYLCWGKEAQVKCAKVNKSKNCILSTSHPSPLGAYKTAAPFMTSRCFSRCNKYLVDNGKEPIDWNLGK
jgi:uracil-DNA glycosylase